MFKRIIHDHWTDIIPIIGFVLTFAVFFTALLRACFMKKAHCQQLSQLPLDHEEEPQSEPHSSSALRSKPNSCQCDRNCKCCFKKSSLSHEAKPQLLIDN